MNEPGSFLATLEGALIAMLRGTVLRDCRDYLCFWNMDTERFEFVEAHLNVRWILTPSSTQCPFRVQDVSVLQVLAGTNASS